jgi:hypothetical protein
MDNIYDPFGSGADTGKSKRALLLPTGPDAPTVRTVVKLALYKGQSINFYDMVSGQHRTISRPPQSLIDQYIKAGHEIEHPAIPYTEVDAWIAHGKREAERLGLTVA